MVSSRIPKPECLFSRGACRRSCQYGIAGPCIRLHEIMTGAEPMQPPKPRKSAVRNRSKLVAGTSIKPVRSRDDPPEHALQVSICQLLDLYAAAGHLAYTAVPNGGKRPTYTKKNGKVFCPSGARLKAEGVKAGVSDLLIWHRNGTFQAEIKTKSGATSPSQREWHRTMDGFGVRCYVWRSLESVEPALADAGIPIIARMA